MANNNFDFGFTFEDTEASAPIPQSDFNANDFKDELLTKISLLEDKLESLTLGDTQELIKQHKELLTSEIRSKLHQVENLIMPLLHNLQANPDKDYIHWPNRKDIIQQQIDKILEVTQYYG